MECGYCGYMGIVDQNKPHETGLLQLAAFMANRPAKNWYAASEFLVEVLACFDMAQRGQPRHA